MFLNKTDYINKFNLILSIIVIIIPFAQITGPFLTDLLLSICALSYLIFIIIINNKLHISNKYLNILIIFWIYISLNALFSDYKYLSIRPSLTFFRFVLFSFFIIYIINNNKKFFESFNLSLIFVLSLIIFDGYFQFIFGKNIIGLEKVRPDRLSSFFHEELILGSFLLKFLPLILFFYYQNIKLKKIKFFNTLIIIFIIPLIFLSGERAAFFLSILYCILILPFIFSFKKLIVISFCFVSISVLIINSSHTIYDRYIHQLKDHLILKIGGEKVYFPEHIGLFNSAYNNFLENKLIGSGVKSFRKTCEFNSSDFKLKLQNIQKPFDFCSTHPHNYYLQFLSELGLIGFFFLVIVFSFLIVRYLKSLLALYFKRPNDMLLFKKYVILLSGLIMYLWPITTSGNFFNNYNSSFIFMHLGFFLSINNEYFYKYKK